MEDRTSPDILDEQKLFSVSNAFNQSKNDKFRVKEPSLTTSQADIMMQKLKNHRSTDEESPLRFAGANILKESSGQASFNIKRHGQLPSLSSNERSPEQFHAETKSKMEKKLMLSLQKAQDF